jgi:CheY-like chemotaxis protein
VSIRVLLADDQPLVLAGLRTILDAEPDIEVVGAARDGAAAVELAAELAPDLVLLDIRMPGMDGITATREILRAHGPRVVILTTFDLDEYVYDGQRPVQHRNRRPALRRRSDSQNPRLTRHGQTRRPRPRPSRRTRLRERRAVTQHPPVAQNYPFCASAPTRTKMPLLGESAGESHPSPLSGPDVPGSGRESHPPAPTDPDVNLSVHPARAAQLSGRGAVLPVREQAGCSFCDGGQPCPCPFAAALQVLVFPLRPADQMAVDPFA